jgi:hypothetical protein
MLSLTWTQTSFSMAAGGGVPGKGNGTARIIMIQVGATIAGVRLFIEVYPRIGGITTGRIAGKGVNGISKKYPTSKSSRTGKAGRRINIGRKKIIGVSKVRRMIERDQENNSRMINMNKRATMKEEEIRKT